MKRILPALLLIAALLSGCTSPAPNAVDVPNVSAAPTLPVCPDTLMDACIPAGGHVSYIPNDAVEQALYPEIRAFDGDLLLSELDFDTQTLSLKRISLMDGSVTASTEIPDGADMVIRTVGDRIALCSSCTGMVTILSGTLATAETYHPATPGDTVWRIGNDLTTLYSFDWDSGINAEDLTTGNVQPLIAGANSVYCCNERYTDYTVFSYVSMDDLLYHTCSLDLATGEICSAPLHGDIVSGNRSGGVWLLTSTADYVRPRVYTPDMRAALPELPGTFLLLSETGQLLWRDDSCRTMKLYDNTGHYLSGCALPELETCFASDALVWSELRGGYFFLGFDAGKPAKLMFWDMQETDTGDDLTVMPLPDDTAPGGITADPALYARAQALSERFSVDIRIADQCALTYPAYTSCEVNDYDAISDALDVIEAALSVYPADFFVQLRHEGAYSIRFELVGLLTPTSGDIIAAAAFAEPAENCYRIVVDTGYRDSDFFSPYEVTPTVQTFYHEITHVIDSRLYFSAAMHEGALFDETVWLSLQPEGFDYDYSYLREREDIAAVLNSGYFISGYACTFPTEDRATMMALIMDTPAFAEENPPILAKLDYYARCIRDCFDTAGWPAVLPWEVPLGVG